MNIELAIKAAGRRYRQYRNLKHQKALSGEAAMRAVLFNADQLESHGIELATSHTLCEFPCRDHLIARLIENESILSECCAALTKTPHGASGRRPSPAGEWLLDNYWLIEEQIHIARRHLPRGYSRKLPRLAEGPSAGLPRVYDLALEGISHGDGRLDIKTFRRFAASYQRVAPLSLGELWAIPIMLRLALIENIRRVACRVMGAWRDQSTAIEWADRLIEAAEKDSADTVAVLARLASSAPPETSAFVAEFARRLQGQGTLLAHPLTLIEEFLTRKGTSLDQQVRQDTQEQATDQVSMSNSIASLRMLASVNWQEFIESLSLVEATLLRDPAGVYGRIDFATRDRYHHKIEVLAQKNGLPELLVAQTILKLATARFQNENLPGGKETIERRDTHVGYFLSGDGARELRRSLAELSGKRSRPGAYGGLRNNALSAYLGAALGFTVLFSLPFFLGGRIHAQPFFLSATATVAWIWVAGQIALKLVNWLVTVFFRPHVLPAMDFSQGIPDESRTLVVIPTLVGNPKDVSALCARLEVHYLANKDTNLQFGILSDFRDSDSETEPGDTLILEAARNGINELNKKYPGNAGVDTFFLCHRPRR